MSVDITIVGLGPGDAAQITREAWTVLEASREVYLRTSNHPCVAALPSEVVYHSFDDLYEAHDGFAQVYEEIAERVLSLGKRPEGVVYAVPGHPLVGETSAHIVVRRARELGLETRIVAGVSFLEPTLSALGLDPFEGLQVCDATLLAQKHHPNLDPDTGALIAQLYSRFLAGELKITLMNLYHDDYLVTIVRHAGTADEQVRQLPLYDLDRQEGLDHLTSLYIPPLDEPGSVSSYQDIVARLRAPGGCPWDRQQTHQSLRAHLLEETYEVLAALDAEDMESLAEELGDLLLQILLHAQIATEDGDFRLIDCARQSIGKLVRRHPHVFGEAQVDDADDVLRSWEQIKRQEKGDGETFSSMLAGINVALPALSQAMEIQRRVARVGFDWLDQGSVVDKVREEIEEFRQASDSTSRAAEFGDLLFSLVNLARWCETDPESVLREASQRFSGRFSVMERRARQVGRPLEELSPDEMDALWEEAKRDD